MDISVLDKNFEVIAVLDSYESFLWTDRYAKEGQCELYTAVTDQMLQFPVKDNYLQIKESDHTMIIEDITIENAFDSGSKIKIVGRSLESILSRRILWGKKKYGGNLQNIIHTVLNENIISPTNADRKIPNFVFQETNDPSIVNLSVEEEEYNGTDLLEFIAKLCEKQDIGFKIILNEQNQFVFSLYNGTDRSYKQDILPWVAFRPDFENVVKSNYADIMSEGKNFALIIGQKDVETKDGEGHKTTIQQDVYRTIGSAKGLTRRELFVSDSEHKDKDMSDDVFAAKLDQKATEQLKEHKEKKTFDGEYDTSRMFKYNKDFFLGDIVQVANEYGMEDAARVTEFTWSHSSDGLKAYPVFTAKNTIE